jgi:hypothetical protein
MNFATANYISVCQSCNVDITGIVGQHNSRFYSTGQSFLTNSSNLNFTGFNITWTSGDTTGITYSVQIFPSTGVNNSIDYRHVLCNRADHTFSGVVGTGENVTMDGIASCYLNASSTYWIYLNGSNSVNEKFLWFPSNNPTYSDGYMTQFYNNVWTNYTGEDMKIYLWYNNVVTAESNINLSNLNINNSQIFNTPYINISAYMNHTINAQCNLTINDTTNQTRLYNGSETDKQIVFNMTLGNNSAYAVQIQCNTSTFQGASNLVYFKTDNNPPAITENDLLNNAKKMKNETLIINVSGYDAIGLLFAGQYIIYAPNGSVYYQYNITNLSRQTFYLNWTLQPNITDATGLYNFSAYFEDTHTGKDIINQSIIKTDNQKISFEYKGTIAVNEIKDKTKLTDYNIVKEKDRVNDWYLMTDGKDGKSRNITFTLTSNDKIYYISESKYKAHFVTGDIWRDYEIENYTNEKYYVNRINDFNYEITIFSQKDLIKFKSFGGLNYNYLNGSFILYFANITFISQNPSDINSYNLMNNSALIKYSIEGNNFNQVKINYTITGNGGCYQFINRSCNKYFNEYTSDYYSINDSINYSFFIDDNEAYPYSSSVPVNVMENYSHQNTTISNNLIAISENLSKADVMFIEINAQILTGNNNLIITYCNSSYSFNNNPLTNNNCIQIAQLNYLTPFNHTHGVSSYSKHKLITIPYNNVTNTINGIGFTENSNFILSVNTGSWSLEYLNNSNYPNSYYSRESNNNGNTWNYLSGNDDFHVHYINRIEYFKYFICINATNTTICSAERTDLIDIAGMNPSDPVILEPDGSISYYYEIINFSFIESFSPNNYSINYTIGLYDSAYNLAYEVNNTTNLNYYQWNSSPLMTALYNQSYYTGVQAHDLYNDSSNLVFGNYFYLGICYSNWTDSSTCVYNNTNRTIYYIDLNSCSRPYALPTDNGTSVNCTYNLYNNTLDVGLGETPQKDTIAGMMMYFLYMFFIVLIIILCEVSHHPIMAILPIISGIVIAFIIGITLSIIFGVLVGSALLLYGFIYLMRF